MKVLHVAGARPNFPKIAPLVRAFEHRGVAAPVCHTGQHYDDKLSQVFFDDLAIPRPTHNLGVGSGSHAAQTAAIMERFEKIVLAEAPDLVLVVGDVNSTMACALVAAKLAVPTAHVEAGLRSFDRTMPEETNRIVTDAVCDLLYCSEQAGVENLAREGVPPWRVVLAGNVMIDTLLAHRDRAAALGVPRAMGIEGRYGVVTIHRPSNVDRAQDADRLVEALERTARHVPLVFPAHPRTTAAFARHGLLARLAAAVRVAEPLGYLEFLGLLSEAKIALTDSGGVQEETTVLGVPCLTLRHSTERPATVTFGTNRIVGTDPADVEEAAQRALTDPPVRRVPGFWDGHAADRIADHCISGVLERVRQSRSDWTEAKATWTIIS